MDKESSKRHVLEKWASGLGLLAPLALMGLAAAELLDEPWAIAVVVTLTLLSWAGAVAVLRGDAHRVDRLYALWFALPVIPISLAGLLVLPRWGGLVAGFGWLMLVDNFMPDRSEYDDDRVSPGTYFFETKYNMTRRNAERRYELALKLGYPAELATVEPGRCWVVEIGEKNDLPGIARYPEHSPAPPG